jgi:lipoprotein-releasing system ATP-binding protein
MSDEPLIRALDLSKSYRDGRELEVLSHLDLEIGRGEKVVIIGQSGVGKSTLLHLLGALDRPTTGSVLFGGVDLASLDDRRLARLRNQELGFIFQFHHLIPELTAKENVLLPHLIAGGKKDKESLKRADELLDLVGLSKVKDNPATKMSGGQQQRVAIARALMNGPGIILADEPTGNLDSESSDQVYRLFRRINSERGTTFVIVTHNRKIAEMADRIIEIRDGRIALDLRR